jgi:hypothetical protein
VPSLGGGGHSAPRQDELALRVAGVRVVEPAGLVEVAVGQCQIVRHAAPLAVAGAEVHAAERIAEVAALSVHGDGLDVVSRDALTPGQHCAQVRAAQTGDRGWC